MSAMRQRAVSGIKWSAVSQGGKLGTQLLTTIILARLLLPSDFGVVGMAMVVIGFINIFKDLGTSAAIIQHKELSDGLRSSIFWVNTGFGLAATIILILLAPLGGLLYQELRVVAVLQALAPSFFISGLGILHQAQLERSLSFDSLAKLEITSSIIGAITGIILALVNAGVWSLVFQSLVTVSVATILLWLSTSWRPQLKFQWQDVKTVSRFSLNLTGFNIFNYFARNADYLLIGRYLGAQELGYYTLAYRILLFPIQNISTVISRVMYPVLSTLQDDNQRFASSYLKVVRSIALVTFPLMVGVMALAKPFVLTFFGDKWQPVILLIMILAPVGLIQSIGTTVGPIYQAKGRTDWMLRWGLGAGIFVLLAFIIGLRWGITGVAIAYAVASLILVYPSFSIPFRLIDLNFAQMLRVLRPTLFNSGIMLAALMLLAFILPSSISEVIALVLSVLVGFTVYGLASWIVNQEQIRELWSLSGLGRNKVHEAE